MDTDRQSIEYVGVIMVCIKSLLNELLVHNNLPGVLVFCHTVPETSNFRGPILASGADDGKIAIHDLFDLDKLHSTSKQD